MRRFEAGTSSFATLAVWSNYIVVADDSGTETAFNNTGN